MNAQLMLRMLRAAILVPLFAAYGAYVIVRGVLRALGWISGVGAGLRDEVRCVHGHASATVGRWQCAGCRAVYDGWVGRCPMCGSGASFVACEECGVSVPLPWERR